VEGLDHSTLQLGRSVRFLVNVSLEQRFRERPLLFGDLAERPVGVTYDDLDRMLTLDEERGRLQHGDARRILRTGFVLLGNGATPTYLAVEVSWSVDVSDVQRAAERAGLLRKAGHQACGAVAGWRIQREALDLAERLGVGRVIERELDGEDPAGGDEQI